MDLRLNPRRRRQLTLETLDPRQLLATLAPIPNLNVGAGVGFHQPLDGGNGNPQTYSVTSSNPNIAATIAQGNFLTLTIQHASSGPNDPAFTGNLTFQLFGDLTPLTVSRIEELVNTGFYTSPTSGGVTLPHKNFHRIIPDFVAQGGSRTGTGVGGLTAPGFPFDDEFNQQSVFNGLYQLAMAKSDDDTNDTQFFITYGQPRNLDYQHTIFGQLVAGQDIAQLLENVALEPNTTTPDEPVLITSASLSPTNPDGVVHINATQAKVGDSATITITATDPLDNSQVTRTFTVNVVANVGQDGRPLDQNPFLSPNPTNLVVATNQQAIFQLQAVDVEDSPLSFIVQGGISAGSFTPVQNATASVDSRGIVTVTPANNFTGVINLVVGVKNASNTGTTPAAFDTQAITLTVRNGSVVNLPPIALPGSTNVPANQPSSIQLSGLTANPAQTTQTLSFSLLTSPSNGTITNVNPTAGTFTYTPKPDFQGTDTLTFLVTEIGEPGPSLSSNPATFTINVGGASTGAVRLLDGVLIVTPEPRRGHGVNNQIEIDRVGTTIRVRVNGVFDSIQPQVDDVDRIVVYGSKANDFVVVHPSVTTPATLNGGRGGTNRLNAGSGRTRIHGWFGQNIARGGDNDDKLIGRVGHLRARKSFGDDLVFVGQGALARKKSFVAYPTSDFSIKTPIPPSGQFFRFNQGQPVKVATPGPSFIRKNQFFVGRNYAPPNPWPNQV